jgi:hypothetical protein
MRKIGTTRSHPEWPLGLAFGGTLLLLACAQEPAPPAADAAPALTPVASAPPPASAREPSASDAGPADAGGAADAGAALPGTSEGCPDDMVLVRGGYCPDVEQRCVEHHEEYEADQARKAKKRDRGEAAEKSTVSERCLRYAEPTECRSKERVPMRFCVDRYEYPNKKGELPALLVSWVDAKKTCESLGKRLCTEDEFNFACEGEAMLPYTYGYARDASKCSIDKAYRKRERKLYKYERCLKNPRCKAELEKLDQRVPAGSLPECVSPFGAYDMNGNINEWVSLPGKKYPDRSGLKGGWWGPVRGRCRPTVGFHKEEDYGYEEGFRCCKDAAP